MNHSNYSKAILTVTEKKKSTSAISRELDKNQSTVSRALKEFDLSATNFKPMIHEIFGNAELTAIGDDTSIDKRHAKEMEGTSSMIDQSTKTFANSYKIIAFGLTDGKIFLPIDLEQWVSKDIMGTGYLTKIKLAKKLVSTIVNLGIKIKNYVFDGLYCSEEFINYLNDLNHKFVIKARNSLVVKIDGKSVKLSQCTELKLKSHQNQRTIQALWHGKLWYFTAIKRWGKHGEKTIYLISNFKAKPITYRKIYDSRWTIEKFFRTAKQFLGLKDSSSRIASVYTNHIKCVFFSYGLLLIILKHFRLKSPEEALRKVQAQKLTFGNIKMPFLDSFLESYA
jgi:hypothetical protein